MSDLLIALWPRLERSSRHLRKVGGSADLKVGSIGDPRHVALGQQSGLGAVCCPYVDQPGDQDSWTWRNIRNAISSSG
jgi:hypothetical protein